MERLTVKNIVNCIADTDDINKLIKYDAMLLSIFMSPILIIGGFILICFRYFVILDNFKASLSDILVFLLVGIGFAILLRVDWNIKTNKIVHISSLFFSVFYIYVILRFYDYIGSSIWILGIIPLMISMVQSTRILWFYCGVSLFLCWNYLTFWVTNGEPILTHALELIFFAIMFYVSLATFRVNHLRVFRLKEHLSKIKTQNEEIRKSNERSTHMALHDQLTGLPNRVYFEELLQKTLQEAKIDESQIYVFFIDLDMFKMINDTMGHKYGDEVLKLSAKRLAASIGVEDVVGRISGDEFLVMVKSVNPKRDVTKLANNILNEINKPIFINQNEINITCSIGISEYSPNNSTVETLVKNADLAMYKAKDLGKNNYCFYTDELSKSNNYELEMISALKNAILHEEFELYYQPQVNGITKEIKGIEALLRWNHPTLGMLHPGSFLSYAEKSGLIIPIGEWVLKTACNQNKAWQNRGIASVPIAVNISVKQLCNGCLSEQVSAILKDSGLDPRYLELEIAERIIFTDIDKIRNPIAELKNLGVTIAIDDFGIGDSSLLYLRQLPIDFIKIPREFINGISHSEKDESIINAIISLAENLNLQVIAEGIETKNQLEYLNFKACDIFQGYYFSMPLKANDITNLYCNHHLKSVYG